VFDLEPYFDPVNESPRWWTPEFGWKIDCMLRSVIQCSGESLVEIRVRHCSNRSLSLVSERCRNLQVLSIKSSPNVTDEPLNNIACVCPKLIELDISYCFEITHDAIASIGHKCPNFKTLKRNLLNCLDPSQHFGIVPDAYLDAAPQDSDPEAFSIGNYMPNLTHLELRFSKLTAKGLSKISKGCPNLEIVDLSGCVNVTSRDIVKACDEWKKLKDIKRPNFYIPRSSSHTERYGHWQLYDERFQTDIFRI
jgi:F-box/leucine-rich repeat protein 2/20